MSTIGLNEDVIKKYILNQEESDKIGADTWEEPLEGQQVPVRFGVTLVAASTMPFIEVMQASGYAGTHDYPIAFRFNFLCSLVSRGS